MSVVTPPQAGPQLAGATQHEHGNLPLVIGITGHRDLRQEDISALEDAVANVYQTLQNDYPHTPLVLLSPLAEGADRLAARVAMRCGVKVIVPLPMPKQIYADDFATQESKDEFFDLIQQADLNFELNLVHGSTDVSVRHDNTDRSHQYAHVGAYIVRHCQVLIALWDGVKMEQEGGTSQIVRFMLEGVPTHYGAHESPLDPKKTGPVYHIPTPRKSNPNIQGEPCKLSVIYPEGYSSRNAATEAYHMNRLHIDEFNHDVVSIGTSAAYDLERSKGYVLPPAVVEKLTPAQQKLIDYYAYADVLAQRFQVDTLLTMKRLFIMAFMSLVFFVLYTEFRKIPLFLAGSVVAMMPMYWLYYRAKRGEYQSRYLDYRALAEGLRIQIFWHLAGLHEPVAKHYLRKQRSELDWIRDAVGNWNIPTDADHGHSDYSLVLRHWVDDQRRYFQKNSVRDQERLEKNERRVRIALTATSILTALLVVVTFGEEKIAHLIAGMIGGHGDGEAAEHALHIAEMIVQGIHTTLMSFVVITPGFAATLDGFGEKLAFAEQAKQYQRMRELFEVAAVRLTESLEQGNHEQASTVIRELGEEALAENGDWVMMHREREVEVPHAG